MLNGQLKPAYNLQHEVDSEYITWLTVNPNPTDTKTLIPFLKDMEQNLRFKYTEIVADAGYCAYSSLCSTVAEASLCCFQFQPEKYVRLHYQ